MACADLLPEHMRRASFNDESVPSIQDQSPGERGHDILHTAQGGLMRRCETDVLP